MPDTNGIVWDDQPSGSPETQAFAKASADPRSSLQKRAAGVPDQQGVVWDTPGDQSEERGFSVKRLLSPAAGMAQGIAGMIHDPPHEIPKFIDNTITAQGNQFLKAAEAYGYGPPANDPSRVPIEQQSGIPGDDPTINTNFLRKAGLAMIPGIGPMFDKAGDALANKDYSGGATDIAGNLAAIEGPRAVLPAARAALRGAGRASEAVGRAGYGSALRPKGTLAERAGAIESGLEHGNVVSPEGIDTGRANIEAGENLKDAIVNSDPNRSMSPGPIVTGLNDLADTYSNQAAPSADRASVEGVRDDFLSSDRPNSPMGPIARPGKAARNLTAREFQDMKVGTYRAIGKRGYGERKSASVEAEKTVARLANEQLTQEFPSLVPINADQAGQINVVDQITRRVGQVANQNLTGNAGGLAAVGTIVDGVAGGMTGGLTGITLKVLRSPQIKSQIALALYKAGKGMQTIGEAKSAAEVGIANITDRITSAGPSLRGLSVESIDNPGQHLSRTKLEMFKAGAAVLNKYGPKMSLTDFKARMLENAGSEWQTATSKNGQTTIAPREMLDGSRRALQFLGDQADQGGGALTPHDVIERRTDAGKARGGNQWYKGDVPEMIDRYGEPKTREMMTTESILSPNQGLDDSVAQAVDHERFSNFGGDAPQLGRYPVQSGKQLAAMEPSGPKVEAYDYNKKVNLPGGPDGPEPPFMPIDKIHTKSSGFGDVPTASGKTRSVTSTVRSYSDMQLRMEARRIGAARGGDAQAAHWVGARDEMYGRADSQIPWARAIMDEIDRREKAGTKIMTDKNDEFGFGANLVDPMAHINSKSMASGARDMESTAPGGGGFTITRDGNKLTTGYSYSPYPERATTINRALSSKDLKKFANENQDLLSKPNHHLGGWKSGDRRVLDVSVHEPDFQTAMDNARASGQEEIYDHANNTSIPVPSEPQTQATVLWLKSGKMLESDPVPINSNALPTHLHMMESAGLKPDDIVDTGFRIGKNYDRGGGGGSIGRGSFTLADYERMKAAKKKAEQ
jgi:hypothetical protein